MGRSLTGRFRPKSASTGEALVFDAAIGLGILAYIIFAMGLLGLLHFPVFLGLLVASAVFSWFSLVTIAGEVLPAIKTRLSARLSLQSAIFGGAFATLGGLALIGALAPPIASDWDGLAYHLAMPKLYLEAGRIFYVPFSSHSNFPFTVEMLYTLGLGLGSIALAKLFHLVFGVLAVTAIYLAARRHFGSKWASLGALIFAGMPIVAWEATVAYLDLALALYTVLPAAAILAYSDTRDSKWLVLAAIAAGLAAGTKMTALASLAVFAVWAGLEFAAGRDTKADKGRFIARTLKQSLIFGVIALVIAAPWYVKSYIHTGNPVYPFLYDTFGGRNWSADLAERYRLSQEEFGVGHGAVDFLRAPWDLVFRSEKFYDRPGLHVGPALLALLPLVIPAALRDRKVLKIGLLSLTFFIIWFLLTQQSRYLIPAFSVAAIGAAGVLSALPHLRFARIAAIAAALATWVISVIILFMLALTVSQVSFGRESYSAFLSEYLDNYRAIEYINENTSGDSRVIVYGDTRGFYLDRDYLWGDTAHNALIPYDRIRDAVEFVSVLQNMGITHVLVNYIYFGEDGDYVRLVHAATNAGLFEEIYRDERFPVAVYTLRSQE